MRGKRLALEENDEPYQPAGESALKRYDEGFWDFWVARSERLLVPAWKKQKSN